MNQFDYKNNTCLSVGFTNRTVIWNVYEGIPETLLLNIILWLGLLLIFAILRNKAWDYGRLALVQSENWTHLFYKNTEDAVEETSRESPLLSDRGCSWFPAVFQISSNRISGRCGPDALHYLSFQNHLLFLQAIITAVSICIVLPINFQGTLHGDEYTFGRTTLSNLPSTSKWLWVHVITSFCFVPLTILVMRRCSSGSTIIQSCTVMVTNILPSHRNTDDIKSYFELRYADVRIKDVKMAYEVKKLIQLEQKRAASIEARTYILINHKYDMKLRHFGCVLPWRTVTALQYYLEEEIRLTDLVILERKKALDNTLGIAFVTVETEEQANCIIDTFVPGSLRNWNVTRAPLPSDINWENLQISTRHWYSKAIFINLLLFIVLFFLTTPAIILNMLNTYTTYQKNLVKVFSPLLAEFVATLLLLSVSAVMPIIVAYTGQWMSHWTKSRQNHETMLKTFFFLLFMVLILPSLGLTSAKAFLESSLHAKNSTGINWDCIFLPDNGAFFVNYVITSAFIGTALELLRFPELAMYIWRLLLMKSSAEKSAIRKEILSVFPFGIHYAWTLLNFTVSTVYSLICPLITPFDLLYLCLKHLVDKHNIYYVYKPITMCGEGQLIHATAIRMVRTAVILLQLTLAAFAVVRGGFGTMSIITIVGSVCTILFYTFLSPFPSCKPKGHNIDAVPEQNEYIAPVLLTSENLRPTTDNILLYQPDYGSSNINAN